MRDYYADARNGGMVHQIFLAAREDTDEFVMLGGSRAVAIGVLLAVLAAIANGSFAVLSKSRSVRSARVDPYIFNFWAWSADFSNNFSQYTLDMFHWLQ